PMAAWGLGGVGLFAGWSADPGAPAAVVAVAGAAVALISAVPTRLAQGDPSWLDAALGVAPGRMFWVRAVVGLLYAQGAILPPILALFIRQGSAALMPLLALQCLALLSSLAASFAAWRMRGRGVWLYAPLAVLVWAVAASLAAR
ncbi:MAG: hypothetical protein GXP62_21130, partial [Oligoflexia bacterium]|nr:hypothetical protein [Oligoflexia bacterium]